MDDRGSFVSMADQHRNFRVRQHLGRHTAKHDCRDPAPAMRGHDDEVAASLLGGLDDGFVRMILFDLHGFADDTSQTRCFGDAINIFSACTFARAACSAKAPDIS